MGSPHSVLPTFSIVIPARNEEKWLPLCLDALAVSLELCGVSYEIIVVINRCNDRTEEIARARACKIVHDNAKNLSHLRNAGAAVARGEILLTVDADSRVSPNMLPRILHEMKNDDVIGGGVLILPERISLGIFLSGLLLLPLVLVYRIQGGVFFLRLEDFKKLGGFDESLYSAEDVDFARRLKAFGKRQGRRFSLLFRSYIITSCRKFDEFGDWYFLRNLGTTISLLRGKNQEAANRVWYDFQR